MNLVVGSRYIIQSTSILMIKCGTTYLESFMRSFSFSLMKKDVGVTRRQHTQKCIGGLAIPYSEPFFFHSSISQAVSFVADKLNGPSSLMFVLHMTIILLP